MSITDTLGRRPALPPRLVMLASFAGTSVVNYGFGLASGWLLLPADFGLLAFAQTVLLIAGLALNSGFAWSLTKESVGVDEARRGALVRGAAVANLLLALAIAGAITLLYVFGPFRNGLETTMILVLVILALPPLAFIAIARAAAQGAERFGLVALLQIGEVGSKAIAGTGLILAGLGPAGAVAGFVVGGLVAGLAGIWVVAGKLQVRLRGPLALGAVRKAAPIFGALLGTALLLNLDILLLKILVSGNRAVAGHYQAAIVLANTPYFLTTAMIPVLFTQATRARALEHTAATVGEALRWVLLLAIPIEIGVLIAPEAALALLFPDEYRPGQLVIRSLALGNCALIVLAVLSATFQATGHARVPAKILGVVVLCEALLLRVSVPVWEARGAALTFAAAAVLAVTAVAICYLRAVGPRVLWPARPWLIRYGLVLGGCCLVAVAVLRMTNSLVLAILLVAPCYVVGAVLLRLVSLPRFASLTSRKPALLQAGKE